MQHLPLRKQKKKLLQIDREFLLLEKRPMKQSALLLISILGCISAYSQENIFSSNSRSSNYQSTSSCYQPHKITAGEHLRSRSSRSLGGDSYNHLREPLQVKVQRLLANNYSDAVAVGLLACQNYAHNNQASAAHLSPNFRSFFLDGGTIDMLAECNREDNQSIKKVNAIFLLILIYIAMEYGKWQNQ